MHPGYPDRPGMGRRTLLPYNSTTWNSSLVEQAVRFCEYVKPAYVKPHGAFYNDTALPLEFFVPPEPGPVSRGSSYVAESKGGFAARILAGLPGGTSLATILLTTPCLMGLPGTMHEWIAGSSFIREGFADRAYEPHGTLVPRSEPGAVLEDPEQIRQQVLDLAPKVDSICLHGDTPNCLEFAEIVFKTLVDAGYEVGY